MPQFSKDKPKLNHQKGQYKTKSPPPIKPPILKIFALCNFSCCLIDDYFIDFLFIVNTYFNFFVKIFVDCLFLNQSIIDPKCKALILLEFSPQYTKNDRLKMFIILCKVLILLRIFQRIMTYKAKYKAKKRKNPLKSNTYEKV